MYQLQTLIEEEIPDIEARFKHAGGSPFLFAAPWFLTVFANEYPIDFAVDILSTIVQTKSTNITLKVKGVGYYPPSQKQHYDLALFYFCQVSLELLVLYKEDLSVATGLEEVMKILKKDIPNDTTKLGGIKSKVNHCMLYYKLHTMKFSFLLSKYAEISNDVIRREN